LLQAASAEAQVVRGVVRTGGTLQPVDRAQLVARDSAGSAIALATSDSTGFWQFRARPLVPFTVEIRRLGFAAGRTTVPPMQAADTAEIEFIMTEVAALADVVTINAEPGMNDRRLADAQRSGWKVFEPQEIMLHREKSRDFFQLLRSLGSPGLIIPRNINDCVRSTRNNRCLTYVVDGQVLGPSANILPNDIYFMAVLSSSQSSMQYGDRAPFGAIYLITRSALDRVQPPGVRRPPPPARRPPPR